MIILTICAISLFGGLLLKAIKLFFRVTWGVTKIIGALLCVIAFPLLLIVAIPVGGVLLLLPVLLVAAACIILSAAV